MTEKLSILIITKNAAETFERTLESVKSLANIIVVVDNYSTDTTCEIAQKYDCRIVRHHCYDFGEQRAFALTQVTTEWTLVLDSDEVLTEENRKEIKKAMRSDQFDGYFLLFRNHLFGKRLQHGELHKKLVLFKTQKASIRANEVHEQYEVQERVSTLPSEVLHFSYRSVWQIICKFFDYAVRQAKQYKREKKQYGVRELFLNPLHMFYSRYIVDGGYKDGVSRIFLDGAFAKMEFFSYALIPFVKEKRRISVDCGSYDVNGIVQSGINRVIQGIYSHQDVNSRYYWYSFDTKSAYKLPTRGYSQFWLSLETIIKRCDVFLGTGGTIPWFLQFFPIKKVLFLYDFGFFSSPDKYGVSAKRLQAQTDQSIKRADSIVILHNEIYKEFANRYSQYAYKATIIPAGVDHLEKVVEQPVLLQFNKPFVLYVGVVKPVKRIDKILSVVGETPCVIAGSQEREYVKTLKIGKKQTIQFVENFSDSQLKWLYKNADTMVYASEHEGFCYPVLEALTLGLPVIAFDLPIFRTYQRFFSHLVLVKTESEMRRELQKTNDKKNDILNNHPYQWNNFNIKLNALWQPDRLPRQNHLKVGFIVVRYKTSDAEIKRLENEIKKIGLASSAIYWIDNSTNGKGYAAGVNEGMRRGIGDGCDYFFALNPDISLEHFSSESLLLPAQMFDVWGYSMKQGKDVFYGGEIDKWRLSGGLINKKPVLRFTSVDFISGSVMGFSKEVVQTIGLWDESYFMYYEDVDYCVRAKKAGFTVGIDSRVIYDHFEISQLNKKKQEWIAKSRWKFFWKYANIVQKAREIIRLPKTIFNK